MAEHRSAQGKGQQARRVRVGRMLAIVILVATPVLVVGGLHVVTRTHFLRLEIEHGPAPHPVARFRAFENAYASGVMAVTVGSGLADLSAHLIELLQQNRCVVREANLINDGEGRTLALQVYDEDAQDWRSRFAEALFLDLRRPVSAFSVDPATDPRVHSRCRSA